MKTIKLTKLDVKTLVLSVFKVPCLVTDASVSFQFVCNPKLLVMLGMFNDMEDYVNAMSANRDVLYFERRLVWDVDDGLVAVVDMRDDNGIVDSIMVALDGDGADVIKDILKANLGGNTPNEVLSDGELASYWGRLASIQMAAPLLGLK